MPRCEVAVARVGDHFCVVDPIEIQRKMRRRIERDGLSANVAADVNVVVSTGGGTAHARQDAPIRQTRSSRTDRRSPEPKEQP